MSRVTSKLQVTIPKEIANLYGIEPGDDIEWLTAGDAIRVVPRQAPRGEVDREFRLALFDAATERQLRRQGPRHKGTRRTTTTRDRGWTREDLYTRGGSD